MAAPFPSAWHAHVRESASEGRPPDVGDYAVETLRDTLENWQSEFLQLLWQVGGLAILLYVGSPQSREGDQRKEEKLDRILRAVDPADAERVIALLARKYPE